MKQKPQLSEEEIIRDWSLNSIDISFIRKFKTHYQLYIYLQICALKLFGQLLDNPNTIDARIIGHACKLLIIEAIGTVKIPSRPATRSEYKKLIFSYLNFQEFNIGKSVFQQWLETKVISGILVPEKLLPEAETFLVANKIALPTLYHLRREINSCCAKQQELIFIAIYQQLSETLILIIDELLEITPDKDKSWFQKFKEYPDSASISVLQEYLKRYNKLVVRQVY